MTLKSFIIHDRWPYWTILLLAIGIYLPSLGYDFTQDDAIVIYENEYVQQGLSGIKKILTTDSFSGFFSGKDNSGLVTGGRYRPLTPALFAVVHQIAGSTPWCFHLLSVLSYGLLCLLIFHTLRTVNTSWTKVRQDFFAFIATAIYAVHPIHTEVVANVKSLDEIFTLLFSLISFLFARRFLRSGSVIDLAFGGVTLFLALMSKETSAPMVVLIPLFAFVLSEKPLRRFKSISGVAVSCMVAFGVYLTFRLMIVGSPDSTLPAEMMNNPFIKVVDGQYLPFTASERYATIIYGLGKYIQLLFFPHPLTHDYYPRHIGVMSFGDAAVWLSLVMHASLLLICAKGMMHRSMTSLMILFFYATLLLTSNVLFPIGTHLSERFLFMPSLAYAVVVGAGLTYLICLTKYTRLVIYAAIGIGLLMIAKTVTRSSVWQDDYTLFTTDVRTSTNSAKVLNAAGGAILHKVSLESIASPRREEMISEAVQHLLQAQQIHPRYKEAFFLLGNAYTYLEQYDEAIPAYEKTLGLDPYHEKASDNLMIALKGAAKYAGSVEKNSSKAARLLSRVLKERPNDFDALALMGTALGSNGQHSEAITYYNRAITVNPDVALTYVNKGLAQLFLGLEDEAQATFEKALQRDPTALDNIRR